MASFVFVDPRVQDAGIGADTKVVVFDISKDGIQQIASALAGADDLDSIHVLSHGSTGTLYLGSTVLTESNLCEYEAQPSLTGSALSASGDILLYGCNVAPGTVGGSAVCPGLRTTRERT